jgi:hypothetical protein
VLDQIEALEHQEHDDVSPERRLAGSSEMKSPSAAELKKPLNRRQHSRRDVYKEDFGISLEIREQVRNGAVQNIESEDLKNADYQF